MLLSSSRNPNFPPILIEILVTHKCTENKIGNGVRIIEIPIQSETQIDKIVDDCKINGVRIDDSSYEYNNKNRINLYNFNKVESINPKGIFDEFQDNFDRKNTIVFLLNQQGQFRSFDCQCYEVGLRIPQRVHYLVTETAVPFKKIFQEFSKRGVHVRNCFICKFSKQDYYGDRLCVLYKKYNLPRKPSPYYGKSCPYFREDKETGENALQLQEFPSTYKFYFHICKEIL